MQRVRMVLIETELTSGIRAKCFLGSWGRRGDSEIDSDGLREK
jgi:hypothetical protein